ncbi:MAG: sigma-54 dependent transcriptional regulator [Sandaracinus sp.]
MARVLVVDDEDGVREFVSEALALDGHEVSEARDGGLALTAIGAEAFDVVVTDLKMPGIDGMEVVRRVRASAPETEIVVLTAHGTVDTAVEAMKLGARDYLQKPIGSPAELRLVVARALEHRTLAMGRERERAQASGPTRLSYGDPAMQPVLDAIAKVARTSASVILFGESGTGKSLVARAIHDASPRGSGPFVAVNCAALPANLIESELFGHEKGSFTGAHAQRRGRIELAEGGTFFLDEIGELAPELQAKLLRVLEEKTFERVGGSRTLRADVRWIAATHRDLKGAIASGKFREDLYHRLAVFPVHLPPLRERKRDLVPLAESLLAEVCAEIGHAPLTLDESARRAVLAHDWPGNIRELRNALERGAIVSSGNAIDAASLAIEPAAMAARAPSASATAAAATGGTLEALELEAIKRALAENGGNRKKAAAALGIGVRTLYEKLKRYGIG